MAWHDLSILLVQLFPENQAPYDLNDVLAILRDAYPELRHRLTYKYVNATYHSLYRRAGTREIVTPIDLKERHKHFHADGARRIARAAVKRQLPINIRKVNAFEAELEARKNAGNTDFSQKSELKRESSGTETEITIARGHTVDKIRM